MNILYTKEEFENTKSYGKLPRECQYCEKVFYIEKRHILNSDENRGKFCSNKCKGLFHTTNTIGFCKNCNKKIKISAYFMKKYKNHFCSQSCASKYNNTHKTTGTRKSKLEKYLELQLIKLYPNLEIHFNSKDAINSELDIYIPSLKLAFELNGIFHYEPIYGKDKLQQILNNDNRKFQACIERGIELCIIDCSQHKYVTEQTSEKYLNIIIKIIQEKVG